jgi:hypothetical protein
MSEIKNDSTVVVDDKENEVTLIDNVKVIVNEDVNNVQQVDAHVAGM